MVDFRNFLVHNYDSLDDTIIWSSVTDKLPPLYKKVCELRSELDLLYNHHQNLLQGPKCDFNMAGELHQWYFLRA
ncbi:MAG: DUF86 domain-containing protein [Rhodobacteraceae bacterium]|nr:DUF86 domain-containing protein [Paracoccaceae bacterium]MYF45616.1 DUF86 domain-containing protein [Paracoccaceae bacterium]MYI91910.1 DUF86 domain-containing protein [Paracoccaceae bacterium]